VSWSYAQTLFGTAITLLPLLMLNLFSQATAPATAGKVQPPSRAQDLLFGISSLVLTSVVEVVFLIAPLYYALRTRPPGTPLGEGLRALGFRQAPLRLSLVLVGAGLLVSLFVAMLYDAIVQRFHLALHTNAQTLQTQVRSMPFSVIGILIGAVIVAPICEELFFRGFLFPGLLQGMRLWPAVFFSAALFTLAHGDLGSAAPLFVLGVLLPLLRWQTGSIWPCIALHMANNALAGVLILGVLLGH
jgi:membrane protease YdiL (CAAX protease family)